MDTFALIDGKLINEGNTKGQMGGYLFAPWARKRWMMAKSTTMTQKCHLVKFHLGPNKFGTRALTWRVVTSACTCASFICLPGDYPTCNLNEAKEALNTLGDKWEKPRKPQLVIKLFRYSKPYWKTCNYSTYRCRSHLSSRRFFNLKSPWTMELTKSLMRISLSDWQHSFQPGTMTFLTTSNLTVIHIHGYPWFDWLIFHSMDRKPQRNMSWVTRATVTLVNHSSTKSFPLDWSPSTTTRGNKG